MQRAFMLITTSPPSHIAATCFFAASPPRALCPWPPFGPLLFYYCVVSLYIKKRGVRMGTSHSLGVPLSRKRSRWARVPPGARLALLPSPSPSPVRGRAALSATVRPSCCHHTAGSPPCARARVPASSGSPPPPSPLALPPPGPSPPVLGFPCASRARSMALATRSHAFFLLYQPRA